MNDLIYEIDDTQLRFIFNPWDSRAFDSSCYDLSIRLGERVPSAVEVIEFMQGSTIDVVTSRIDSSDRMHRSLVLSLGFIQSEVQLSCRMAIGNRKMPPLGSKIFRKASDLDLEAVQEIAKLAFHETRFRDIPGITPALIGNRFSNWVLQLYENNPELAYVLEEKDEVIGFFFSAPRISPGEINLTLGATSPNHSGPYGFYLFTAALASYAKIGFRQACWEISAENLGALNLWAGIGARFPKAVGYYTWNQKRTT